MPTGILIEGRIELAQPSGSKATQMFSTDTPGLSSVPMSIAAELREPQSDDIVTAEE